jgi:hypothetical protein
MNLYHLKYEFTNHGHLQEDGGLVRAPDSSAAVSVLLKEVRSFYPDAVVTALVCVQEREHVVEMSGLPFPPYSGVVR